jgi:hypothetical protein
MIALLLASPLTTWCWSEDLRAPRSCVYSREQCEELVRLRHRGVCTPAQWRSH